MQSFKFLKKGSILLICITIAVLQLTSCTAQIAEDKGAMPIVPDVGALPEHTIDNNSYSEDIVIDIQRPDIMGDDENEETDGIAEDSSIESSNLYEESTGLDTESNSDTENPESDIPAIDTDDKENEEISGTIELYDVPLPAAKQQYVFEMAEEFEIPPELIFGVMYVETRYKENINSANGKYLGIMQIAKSNLKTLNKKFGITDLTDYRQNVKSGAYFLSYFYKKYDGDINKVLMCYHCGEGGAHVQWRKGVTEDNYCRKVKGEIERILAARQ